MIKPKTKLRRVVLGEVHPWFYFSPDHIGLTKTTVNPSILLRTFDWADIDTKGLGNWNKIRLVAEIIK